MTIERPPTGAHERTEWVAERLAAFKAIEPVPLPVLNALVTQMDLLRLTSAKKSAGDPMDGMCIRLTAGVGKTTAATMLRASVAERAGEDAAVGPVLIVPLDVDETISLWSSILLALGDPYYDVGYPRNLKKRAIKILRQRGIGLIIIDEFNHSVDRGQARLMMNTVKEILNAGIAPVVVMGTDEEIERLPRVPAFERRMLHAPVIGPLVWADPEHERNWRGFLQGLDAGIVKSGALPNRSGLGEKQLAQALCEACDGVIGYAYWVVQDALTEVLKRGGKAIDHSDLAISVGRLFVKFELFERVNAVEALA